MKKYSVFSLYVVEIKEVGEVHYYICRRNGMSNTYEEILTNEKIMVTPDLNVEDLADYYSILACCNYKTGQPLMLDKGDILNKCIEINGNACLEKGKALSQSSEDIIDINAILEKATTDFFPKEGVWPSSCFKKPNDLSMEYLPCHLRDNVWLAKMLKKRQKLLYISINEILQFVKTSSFFQEKRHEYEQKIVKWQIEWMLNRGEGWLVDDNYGGDLVFLTSSCDLGFRKGVVDTLSAIGMDINAIEEGIEKNADLWRDSLMEMAFRNEYEPIIPDFCGLTDSEDKFKIEISPLKPADPEHRAKWLKLRKYEYYQSHKDSVDKYGAVDSDMILSSEEIAKIKVYLEQKHEERIAQIEEHKDEIRSARGEARKRRNNL